MSTMLKDLLDWAAVLAILAAIALLVAGTYLLLRWLVIRLLFGKGDAEAERRATSMSRTRTFVLTLTGSAVLVAWLGVQLASLGLRRWVAYAVAAIGIALLFCLGTLLEKERRRAWGCLIQMLLRESEQRDLAAARKAAGTHGRAFHVEPMLIWTDTPADLEALLPDCVRDTVERFAQATGFPARMPRPLRLLCFETEAALDAYTASGYLDIGRARGYYVGLFRKRIALCREISERMPSRLEDTIAHEVTHHLLRSNSTRRLPAWLDEGVAVLVAAPASADLHAPGAAERCLRAALARRELLSGNALLSLTRLQLAKRIKDWRSLADAAFAGTFYMQSGSFVGFLRKGDAEAFQRFLARLPRRWRLVRWFRECFGLTPNQATDLWIKSIESIVPPPLASPAHALKERIERELALPIRSRAAPADERRLAIRLMGATGYPWRADALIETLDDPDETLRAEARRSLENIAGEVRGPDPQAWREWLASLPCEVAAPEARGM